MYLGVHFVALRHNFRIALQTLGLGLGLGLALALGLG